MKAYLIMTGFYPESRKIDSVWTNKGGALKRAKEIYNTDLDLDGCTYVEQYETNYPKANDKSKTVLVLDIRKANG